MGEEPILIDVVGDIADIEEMVLVNRKELVRLLEAAQRTVLDFRESEITDWIMDAEDAAWVKAFGDDESALESALAPFDGLLSQNG